MPLFFILSGFTTKLATDWKTLWKRLKKNFLYLVVPAVLVIMAFSISDTLGKTDITGFFSNFGFWLREFFIENAEYLQDAPNENWYGDFTYAGDGKYQGCTYENNVTVIPN